MYKDDELDYVNFVLDNIIVDTSDCDINYLMTNLEENMMYILNHEMRYLNASMKERFKMLFVNRFINGMSYKEISKIFGVTTERARQIECKFIALLKRPQYQEILKFGKDYPVIKYKEEQMLNKIEALYRRLEETYSKLFEDNDVEGYKKLKETNLAELPTREFGLSVRSTNCLLRGHIFTFGDLVTKTEEELAKIRNLGKKGRIEIAEFLAKHGYTLERYNENADLT